MPELLSVRLRDDGVGDYRSAKLFNTFRSGTTSLFCPHHKYASTDKGAGLAFKREASRDATAGAPHTHTHAGPPHTTRTRDMMHETVVPRTPTTRTEHPPSNPSLA
jgi:hypothetical protein